MDFTVLYRVLWKPGDVFKKFVDRTRPEPLIFIAITVPLGLLYIHRNDLQQLLHQPSLIAIGLLKGLFFSLLWPFLDGIIAYLYVRSIAKYKVQILPLSSAFILCSLPHYISKLVMAISGYPGYLFEMGGLSPSLRETHPFLFSFIAAIDPFFIWVIILWNAALNQLLSISKKQKTILLIIMTFFPFAFSLVWFMFAVMIFNLFNPVR
jgi:hypothetical protein